MATGGTYDPCDKDRKSPGFAHISIKRKIAARD